MGRTDDFSDDMSQYLQTFLDETEEQLDDLVETMLVLEKDAANREELNEAFRLIHSIKGSAGIMGFESIAVLTHHLENRFEQFRSGSDVLDEPTMNLVLRSIDFVRECNGRLRLGEPLGTPIELLEELTKLEDTSRADGNLEPTANIPAVPVPETVVPEIPETTIEDNGPTTEPAGGDSSSGEVRMLIRFRPGLQLADLKARLIVNRLNGIGIVKRTTPDLSNEEGFENLEEFQVLIECDNEWDQLRNLTTVEGVETVEFFHPASLDDTVTENSSGSSKSGTGSLDGLIHDEPSQPALSSDLSDNRVANAETANVASNRPTVDSQSDDKTATADNERTASSTKRSDPSPTPPTTEAIEKGVSKVAETMRVDINRLDNLMNLTGELVVNRARFEQISEELNPHLKTATMRNRIRDFKEGLRRTIEALKNGNSADNAFASHIQQLHSGLDLMDQQAEIWDNGRQFFGQIEEAINQLSRVSDNLQRGVLDTRMVPVGPLFSRFKRLVRDLSKDRDKEVNLVLRGEKTEMDKRLIDELGDPLIHLVRNSMDHGLETPERRIELGKPRAGTICLEASHSGNNVYIQISDDGSGINADKIRSKLVNNGILVESAAAELPAEQAVDYIWDPGFSTAREITDVSGRGVGMDVVKTRIRNLNGTVEVESTPGEGTRFTIRLPLTLAIINCLMVRLNEVTFSIPIDDVKEIVSVKPDDIVSVLGKKTFEVRRQFLPLVDIAEVFCWNENSAKLRGAVENGENGRKRNYDIVVLQAAGKTIGLSVDEFLGSQDIVVKSLSDNFISIRGLSGASILGDGSVSLMLDVGTLVNLAHQNNASSTKGTGVKGS